MKSAYHQIERDGILATRLCTHKDDVELTNENKLQQLTGLTSFNYVFSTFNRCQCGGVRFDEKNHCFLCVWQAYLKTISCYPASGLSVSDQRYFLLILSAPHVSPQSTFQIRLQWNPCVPLRSAEGVRGPGQWPITGEDHRQSQPRQQTDPAESGSSGWIIHSDSEVLVTTVGQSVHHYIYISTAAKSLVIPFHVHGPFN